MHDRLIWLYSQGPLQTQDRGLVAPHFHQSEGQFEMGPEDSRDEVCRDRGARIHLESLQIERKGLVQLAVDMVFDRLIERLVYRHAFLLAKRDVLVMWCEERQGSPNREAFIARSGKMLVPYLVDTNTQTQMFESADIITYLRETYAV